MTKYKSLSEMISSFSLSKEDIKKDIQKMLDNNKYLYERVKELKATEEQLIDAYNILMDIDEQDMNSGFIFDLALSQSGNLVKIAKKSSEIKKNLFYKNIVTQNIFPLNFDDEKEFFKEPERRELIAKVKDILDGKIKKGLYIYGDMGIGKTFILQRTVKKFAQNGYKCAYVNLQELSQTLKQHFNPNDDMNRLLLNTLKNTEVLFIDEIGGEIIAPWFRDEFLSVILNSRSDNDRLTFFTSNFDYEKLQKQESFDSKTNRKDYFKSNRLIERVKALSIPVFLKGKNKRY